jgi:hypothetical protein
MKNAKKEETIRKYEMEEENTYFLFYFFKYYYAMMQHVA